MISYRHADGGFSSVAGCVQTDIFLGSTDAKYGSTQGGPVNKQAGPTDILFMQSDLCGEPVGKGYPLIRSWQGQAMIGLQSNAQFSVGWVQGSVPVTDDVSGVTARAVLMLALGASPKTVQMALGHASIGITMNTYASVLPEGTRANADAMAGLLLRSDSTSQGATAGLLDRSG